MTLIQELGMLLDEMERVKGLGGPSDGWWHDVDSLEFTLKSIIKDARCPACEGSGENSPMPDDACMGCSGSGVQN